MIVVFAAAAAAAAMQLADAARRRRLHDAETGLPNRSALEEALRSAPHAGIVAARIVEFDKIAAALGPAGAAEVIGRIRDRIAHLQEDPAIYRVEDRVLCWRCDDKEDLDRRLTTLRALMLQPVEVRGRRVDATMAIGYARGQGHDADQLVANAAFAAAKARAEGTAWHVHHARDEEEIERELSLLSELDEAVANRQIEVLYQPKHDIAQGRITSVEALARLRPAYRDGGLVHAGNSSQITDGAAAVLIGDADAAQRLGLKPQARVLATQVVGVDPVMMLHGVIDATRRVLDRVGLEPSEIDLYEVNEAFASVVLAWQRELRVPLERVNVNGGAIALGHPTGCSGTRLMTTLVHEMQRRGVRYGLAPPHGTPAAGASGPRRS